MAIDKITIFSQPNSPRPRIQLPFPRSRQTLPYHLQLAQIQAPPSLKNGVDSQFSNLHNHNLLRSRLEAGLLDKTTHLPSTCRIKLQLCPRCRSATRRTPRDEPAGAPNIPHHLQLAQIQAPPSLQPERSPSSQNPRIASSSHSRGVQPLPRGWNTTCLSIGVLWKEIGKR